MRLVSCASTNASQFSANRYAGTPMMNTLMWFRRDLRATDNAALFHALKTATQLGGRVHCVFIFDATILAHLPRQDRRVTFIWDSLLELDAALKAMGGAGLHVLHGNPVALIPALVKSLTIGQVHTNHDDEPAALARDAAVAAALQAQGAALDTAFVIA
jgi:deoxyribodipyrimidine photo-lyase